MNDLYIIAEAAQGYEGSLEVVKLLVRSAACSGDKKMIRNYSHVEGTPIVSRLLTKNFVPLLCIRLYTALLTNFFVKRRLNLNVAMQSTTWWGEQLQ